MSSTRRDSDPVATLNGNRERVFESAKDLFSRFGFRKTTVDEIAEQAGISKRTMYKVFRSKEEILAELVMHEARSFRRFYMSQIRTLDDPVQKVEWLCRLTCDYFCENPFLGRVMSDDERLFTPFLGEELHLVEDGIREIISRLLNEGMQAGNFREMDVPDMAESILALMRAFAYHQAFMDHTNSEWISLVLHGIKEE
jgi:AcrR family transcriptional regulator